MPSLDDLTIGVFWAPRPQTAPACAQTLIRAVRGLYEGLGDPFGGLWYGRDSPREPRRRFVPETSEVGRALANAAARHDASGTGITDLGYGISLDEGQNRLDQARLTFSCGITSPRLWNSLILDPPRDLPVDEGGILRLRLALSVLISASDPDWGRVDSLQVARTRELSRRGRPNGAWMIYLPVEADQVPSMPAGVQVSPVARGCLVTTTTEWFDPDRAAHLAVAREVEWILERAGLLEPRLAS